MSVCLVLKELKQALISKAERAAVGTFLLVHSSLKCLPCEHRNTICLFLCGNKQIDGITAKRKGKQQTT